MDTKLSPCDERQRVRARVEQQQRGEELVELVELVKPPFPGDSLRLVLHRLPELTDCWDRSTENCNDRIKNTLRWFASLSHVNREWRGVMKQALIKLFFEAAMPLTNEKGGALFLHSCLYDHAHTNRAAFAVFVDAYTRKGTLALNPGLIARIVHTTALSNDRQQWVMNVMPADLHDFFRRIVDTESALTELLEYASKVHVTTNLGSNLRFLMLGLAYPYAPQVLTKEHSIMVGHFKLEWVVRTAQHGILNLARGLLTSATSCP